MKIGIMELRVRTLLEQLLHQLAERLEIGFAVGSVAGVLVVIALPGHVADASPLLWVIYACILTMFLVFVGGVALPYLARVILRRFNKKHLIESQQRD